MFKFVIYLCLKVHSSPLSFRVFKLVLYVLRSGSWLWSKTTYNMVIFTSYSWWVLLYPFKVINSQNQIASPKCGRIVSLSNERSWSYTSRFKSKCEKFKFISYSLWVLFQSSLDRQQMKSNRAWKWVWVQKKKNYEKLMSNPLSVPIWPHLWFVDDPNQAKKERLMKSNS